MKMDLYVSVGYAVLLFIGGLVGYATAGSIPSLIMGSVAALLFCICGVGMMQGRNPARVTALICALLLMAFFGYRFALTTRFFPGGFMAIASLLFAFFLSKRRKAN